MNLRPEVRAFAEVMEQKLREHDDRPGWKDCAPGRLLTRLLEEVRELDDALFRHALANKPKQIACEAADVANFAMMIADVCGGLPAPTPAPLSPEVASALRKARELLAAASDGVVLGGWYADASALLPRLDALLKGGEHDH